MRIALILLPLLLLCVAPVSAQARDAQAADAAPKPTETNLASGQDPYRGLTKREREFRVAVSRRLTPLIDRQPDADTTKVIMAAIALARHGKAGAAREKIASVSDPAAKKLIDWFLLVNGVGSASDYRAFLSDNPMWPLQHVLRRRFEQSLLRDGGSARQIKSDFAESPPRYGAGLAALASAENALGNKATATELVKKAWCHHRISASIEGDFLRRFENLLDPKDHKCRLDRLLVSNPRGRSIRRSRAAAARRLIPRLAPGEKAKAEARIALFEGRQRKGFRLLRRIVAKQPKSIKRDWGFAYQRIVRSRRRKDYAHAAKLMKGVPGDDPSMVNRGTWWLERRRLALHVLKKGQARTAYQFVADVRPEDVNQAKDQAFFAGWLAYARLKQPATARRHFARMTKLADGPLSRSTAHYWLARSLKRLGRKTEAKEHFAKAAAIRDTFHALLAKRAIKKRKTFSLPEAKSPSEAETQRFLANDAVRALRLAYAVKLRRRLVLAFYRQLGRKLPTAGELVLLAQFASHMRDGQGEVRTGKAGIARGFDLFEFAYPTHHLPDYDPLRPPAEKALLYAVARQESEFNTRIVSRAGARGVLQVMPITAKHICRQYRIRCQVKRLLSDPSYNTRIASAYIADRRDDFSGSYILTLTGFNAGPGRTRQWLREFGDPRDKKVVPLDWIYRIPFEETRKYVRKVLSNLQVYRARLGEAEPLRIDLDLKRGRRG